MGKFNLNLLIFILVILVLIMQVRSCLAKNSEGQAAVQTNVIVNSLSAEAAAGLDLEAVGALLAQAKDAEELERQLNEKNGINNLDLNADGVVDFIKVTEFGSGAEHGFSLSTEIAAGEEQEIATIRVQQSGQQANVQIQGNQSLYGQNRYYNSHFGLGDALLFAWLFSPHRPYYSPFAWGYYPGYYGGGYRTVSQTQYNNRASATKQSASSKGSSFQKSNKPQFQPKTSSPKASANATVRRSSLSNPSRSQRSFSSNPSRSSTRISNTSIRRSAGFRSGSSFGGGK